MANSGASRATKFTSLRGGSDPHEEALIAQRAREIANSPEARGDVDNWLRAEREVVTELLAAEYAKSHGSEPPGIENRYWGQARRWVLTAQRARAIANSPQAWGDLDNWLKAERELKAQGLI
jgi:hypothetical protein